MGTFAQVIGACLRHSNMTKNMLNRVEWLAERVIHRSHKPRVIQLSTEAY
jgi:hypothetical protein